MVTAVETLRRRFLQLVGGAIVLPVFPQCVLAQSSRTLSIERRTPDQQARADANLNTSARYALVIGNSSYVAVSALKNPANDASAIAGQLLGSGFQVDLKQDLTRDAMLDAIASYSARIAATKAIGLFYYAGHGLQLAWRNFLVPVEAVINRVEDIPSRCVDLGTLISGITKANNPMNMVILDACRDNPFRDVKVEAKGLSQLDAPPATLLAFATSPGNVASDGEGVNGLYTEHLLREMKVAEAKVEDVFKRVRLNVRLRSRGAQIPWECTSLEDDFYFVRPKALMALADEELERARKQETALREKRLAEEEAERKRRQEQAQRESRLAAEQAERRQQQELALLEKQRIAEETELKKKYEAALQEAQRTAKEAERKRLEEQALREARLAEEEAARKYKQDLALREKRRVEEEAERKRLEEQALREAQLANEEAARKRKLELAQLEQQRAQEDAQRKQLVAPALKPVVDVDRQFALELAIWEKIKNSKEPGPFEDYLLRYPSGQFSELAQLRLDQELARQGEKKIRIATQEGNPYTVGSAVASTAYQLGDTYTYRILDLFSMVEQRRVTHTVTEITEDEVKFSSGMITDLLGNLLRHGDGRTFTPNQRLPLEFAVGKQWQTRFRGVHPVNGNFTVELDLKIVARESITVPAGTFNAFRIEVFGSSAGSGGSLTIAGGNWRAPEVRQPIVSVDRRTRGRQNIAAERAELIEYKQA